MQFIATVSGSRWARYNIDVIYVIHCRGQISCLYRQLRHFITTNIFSFTSLFQLITYWLNDVWNKNQTRIHVSYLSNTFKEIQQMKAYTIMMLFGNVGGFVGLLLGYALIQIPNLVHSTLNSFIGDGLKI